MTPWTCARSAWRGHTQVTLGIVDLSPGTLDRTLPTFLMQTVQ